jgi:hypothetical protein
MMELPLKLMVSNFGWFPLVGRMGEQNGGVATGE